MVPNLPLWPLVVKVKSTVHKGIYGNYEYFTVKSVKPCHDPLGLDSPRGIQN